MLIQITNGETLIVLISIHIFVKLMLVSSFFSNKSIPLCLFLFLLRLIKTHLSTVVFSKNIQSTDIGTIGHNTWNEDEQSETNNNKKQAHRKLKRKGTVHVFVLLHFRVNE
jgi:hypothetical protein